MNLRALIGGVLSGSFAISLAVLIGCAPKAAPPELNPQPAPDASAPVSSLPEPYGVRSLRTGSNVRSEPTTESEVVTTLGPGTLVGLLSLENGWYSVRVDTTVGWVWAPLVDMNEDDRWEAAISAAKPSFPDEGLFTAVYRDDRRLVLILDIAWRDMTKAHKERVVTGTGEAWQCAAQQMGMKPAPEIRFVSNNDVEMARWHAFWGTTVKY